MNWTKIKKYSLLEITLLFIFLSCASFVDSFFSNDVDRLSTSINYQYSKNRDPVSFELTPVSNNFIINADFYSGYELGRLHAASNSKTFFTSSIAENSLEMKINGELTSDCKSLLFCPDNSGESYINKRYANYLGLSFSAGAEGDLEQIKNGIYITETTAEKIPGYNGTLDSISKISFTLTKNSTIFSLSLLGVLSNKSVSPIVNLYGNFVFCSYSVAKDSKIKGTLCSFFDGVDVIGDKAYLSTLFSIYPLYKDRTISDYQLRLSQETTIPKNQLTRSPISPLIFFPCFLAFFLLSGLLSNFQKKQNSLKENDVIAISVISLSFFSFFGLLLEPIIGISFTSIYILPALGVALFAFVRSHKGG